MDDTENPSNIDLAALAESFSQQAGFCRQLGSPWTAELLDLLRVDLDAGGVMAELLADYPLPPLPSAAALRVAGGINALALAGRASELEPWHPAFAAGARQQGPMAQALVALLIREFAYMRDFIGFAVQTNEVQRSGVLAPGFLTLAARTGLPLALREIGTSGGLNLLWDRFDYRFDGERIGSGSDKILLAPQWRGAAAPAGPMPAVLDRRGVDLHPLNLRDPATAARGLAYIWPDQRERVARFRAAAGMLAETDLVVEQGDAPIWLEQVLAAPVPGACAVVFHSVMWQYMPPEGRAAAEAAIRSAAARASAEAPLAWLRFEPVADLGRFELTCDLWPEHRGRERLAWVHPHGAEVTWLAPEDPERRA